ncbi:hypothetical protein HELRODRAFT_65469 [Helobdella robusta]|uniref:TatD related DNase n=1 Tax=Helobdella robusta TaxID=6412 RepID=T1FY82_HELRO|nr:hypothetical protein HELRODRAFT_65469 [Helobdella robusta]ESO02684.1 hypothetical protein HELRODRAFT_65469 [Helobdella robusta]
MGLDYSQLCFRNSKDRQKEVFSELIDIAMMNNRPMVIHSRDAEEDTIDVMYKACCQPFKIHRHCFTGTAEEAKNWLNIFPSSYIGLTPAVTNFRKYPTLRAVIKEIPLNKLLIETDAPYFVPQMMSHCNMQQSHPGMAITVAVMVAKIKQCPLDEVLQEVLKNTKNMYNI